MKIIKAFVVTLGLAAVYFLFSITYISTGNFGPTTRQIGIRSPERYQVSQVRDGGIQGRTSQCQEQKNILLLKTHKTGSSTLQNVLYRFGDVRNLTFALPPADVYMGCPKKFKPSFAMPSPTGKYDILANHARFHKDNMKKVMALGTKFITVLRYPPKQFESMYSFYRMDRRFKCSVEIFSASARILHEQHSERNPRHSVLNPMLYDLGLDVGALDNDTEISSWIKHIDRSFDLVLVAEHMKESLILLKDMMCWSFDDVIYLPSNARSDAFVKRLSPDTEQRLLQWLRGDVKLYNHFNDTLWTKIEHYGRQRMAADVAELVRRNEELKESCILGKRNVSELRGRIVIERYILRPEVKNDMVCKRITYPATTYLRILRTKMKMKRSKKDGLKSRRAA